MYKNKAKLFLANEYKIKNKMFLGIPVWNLLRYGYWKDILQNDNIGLDKVRKTNNQFSKSSLPFLISLLFTKSTSSDLFISNRTRKNRDKIFDPAMGYLDKNNICFILERTNDNFNELPSLIEIQKSILFLLGPLVFPLAIFSAFKNNDFILNYRPSFKKRFSRLMIVFSWILFWKILFKIKVIKSVHVNTHYSSPAHSLLYVCKSKDIKYTEYQHGTIGSTHIAFNSLTNSNLLPDTLKVWGKLWVKNCKGLLNIEFHEKPKYKEFFFENKSIDILFIGQAREDIYNEFLSYKSRFKDKRIEYLPHPQEFVNSGTKLNSPEEALSKSKVVIGVWSTLLLEAINFQCIVWRLPLIGHEVLNEFEIPILKKFFLYSYKEISVNLMDKETKNNIWNNND